MNQTRLQMFGSNTLAYLYLLLFLNIVYNYVYNWVKFSF
jgi:hypothetical protein